MSTARYTHGGPAVTLGEVREERWTCIGADDPDALGRVEVERTARFAWRDEADNWLTEQAAAGWTVSDPVPTATGYHGPTDSSGNCWTARATREENP